MRTVHIADLKNGLSAYLRVVRAGEEILIRDRNLPVARLLPLSAAQTDSEELELVAAGKLRLPERDLDEEAFWALGSNLRNRRPADRASLVRASRRAVSADREDRDAGVLGR